MYGKMLHFLSCLLCDTINTIKSGDKVAIKGDKVLCGVFCRFLQVEIKVLSRIIYVGNKELLCLPPERQTNRISISVIRTFLLR